jgi:prepilin-type N-terminal cleavage/methylation domain-containing protein
MIQSRPHSFRAGFTLVEILVVLAVLTIMIVAASQILVTAANLTTVNNKRMDANDQARMVFDRMANDFARIVKRTDVDFIFWKPVNAAPTTTGINDTMFFFTEGAGYFDSSTFNAPLGVPAGATNGSEKNSFSLVGYRVNNTTTSSTYNQLERLGKALSWDGGAFEVNPNDKNSGQSNIMAFLTYPPAGTDVGVKGVDPTKIQYSTAYFNSTLAGACSNGKKAGALPSAVGTEGGDFNDSQDTSYCPVGSQVFRFEYSFQLKDGTMSDEPVMAAATASNPNGIPVSNLTATQHPLPTDDSASTNGTGNFAVGSRWYDTTNQIGYICVDATPNYALWHEIGIQDIAAVIVTIAVIDKQGLLFANNNSMGTNNVLANLAAKLPDYVATTSNSTVTGDPAYLLDPSNTKGWANALLPGKAVGTMAAPKLPQSMVSQIRLYQRCFYLNNL